MPSYLSIHEHLAWDQRDMRFREEVRHPGPQVLAEGEARGRVIAGNLGTLLGMAGTRWFPDLEGAILCVEDDEVETPSSVDRLFTQLRQVGAFEQIAGLVVGRFHPEVGFSAEDPLEVIIRAAADGFDLPIGIDLDFGHTDPMHVLPNGVMATLRCAGDVQFVLVEPAVA